MAESVECNGCKISIINEKGLKDIFESLTPNIKWFKELQDFENKITNFSFKFYKENCKLVSSLKNRVFSEFEWEILGGKWSEISNSLSINEINEINKDTLDKYDKICGILFPLMEEKKKERQSDLEDRDKTKFTNPYAEINRLFAAKNLGMLCPIINDEVLKTIFKELKKRELISYEKNGKKVIEGSERHDWLIRSCLMHQISKKYSKRGDIDYSSVLPWALYTSFTANGQILNLLQANKNVILTGAPGTGKTYNAQQIANLFAGEKHVKLVQFHPSYDYTDFVEGLRPDNNNSFSRVDGVFKRFCKCAILGLDVNASDKEINDKTIECFGADNSVDTETDNVVDDINTPYVFIIDEINRGEISKIFGELFFCVEAGHRGEKEKIDTQYQNLLQDEDLFKNGFYVPKNVFIIGTMNDIDRSVESMDFAFRRRFAFYDVNATSDMLDSMDIDTKKVELLKNRMNSLNSEIIKPEYGLSSAYQLGGAYFLKYKEYCEQKDDFKKLWEYHLKGLLYEYFRGLPADVVNNNMKKLETVYNQCGYK